MLGELDIQVVFPQSDDFDACVNQFPRELRSQFGRPSASDVTH
jgi:hypothetical protein